uniref:Anti-H(O) lectin 1 n=1 Tax=Cytisophyllum sessilifolium TaxID=3834 RepID=LEC1_CYTSE|nr:RecName: Full=Anti-H(O) lectin 1; AltName: Full=Anti-H(O) lectin I; AltName: Full=CSA-I [Cytisophyllum sessilifolium]prf//1813204A anti-H(O) lectin [Cytisophyllum sessilifolium]
LNDHLSFNFDKFVPNQNNILFQGEASVSTTGVLQVTKVSKPATRSIGRALYAAPVHIWDSTTGRVASFETSFSFVVKDEPEKSNGVDGLTFFLAPANSQIPSGSSAGLFGLFNSSDNKSSNQIIAVEFDTYFGKTYNPWDPDFKHIGVDVNSIKSIKTVKWDWRNGEVANVVITYRAPTKSLTVSLSYPSDQTSNIVTASVDLKAILPEWVSVGFSAGVGNAAEFETHDVLSWYFTSNLEANPA